MPQRRIFQLGKSWKSLKTIQTSIVQKSKTIPLLQRKRLKTARIRRPQKELRSLKNL